MFYTKFKIKNNFSKIDSYLGGMQQPGRDWKAGSGFYRYGFGGQEADNEIYGQGNAYTAEFWEYDPRLGRRWNVDPVMKASQSPYMCFNNNPIVFTDPSGLDGVPKQHTVGKGDNLTKLAKKYNTSVKDLLKWNHNIKDKNKIYEGNVLNVSDPSKDLLVGKTGQVGTGEDAQSSVGQLPPGMKTDENANIPNGTLEKLHSSISTTATLPMRNDKDWVATEENIYNQFYSGNGGINTKTNGIANVMAQTEPLKRLSNQISGAFMAGMINNNGNYSAINLNSIFQTPSFSAVSKPLLAMVGGTQQLDIYLSDIKVHGRQYTAKITFWLWDDYGVSADDCMKGGAVRNMTPINDALKAQWILQHNRGYKPLINGFKFTRKIGGGF